MSDKITATGNTSAKFLPHPSGQFVAQCCDTIDLGEKVEAFPGMPEKLTHKCALVFRTGEKNPETGELIDVAQEYTVSMNEKANLRKALESWRGQPYNEGQISDGVPLDKLTGNWALIGVAHKTSAKGRTYAVVQSIVSVPKAMREAVPTLPPYTRAEFWQDRKDDYAKEAKKFRALHAGPPSDGIEDDGFPPESDAGDSLPFD